MDRKGNDKSFPVRAIEGLRMTGDNFYEEIIIAGFGGQGIIPGQQLTRKNLLCDFMLSLEKQI